MLFWRKGADNLTVFMVIEQDATWVAKKIGQWWRKNILPAPALVFYCYMECCVMVTRFSDIF